MKFLKNKVDEKNIMLTNMIYHRPSKDQNWNDSLDVVYKNVKTEKKYVEHITNPEMICYLVKPEFRNYDYNKEYIELDKTASYKVPYKNIPAWIAKQAGPAFVNQMRYWIDSGNRGAINNFHKWRYVFGTDIDIINFYKTQWLLEYDNDAEKKLNYGCADIETDAAKCDHFASRGEVPILCATFIDEHEKKSYTVYYRAKDNMEQIRKFESEIDDFIDELHESFDESYGKFEYYIYAFDDELEMIKFYWELKHQSSCDIIMYWNMKFDFNFMYERIKILGGDPLEIMCHPDFKKKIAYYKHDHNHFAIVEKRDFVTLSAYFQLIDQMLLYAQTRKGVATLRSSKLNTVAEEEIKDKKLDYSEEKDIGSFPYKNFRKYLLYNIKDVMLQIGIERKTEDVQGFYIRSYKSAVKYEHTFAQTQFLTARQYYEYLKMGIIPGNNCNVHYGEKTNDSKDDNNQIGFSGALVSNPNLMDGSKAGEFVLGLRSNKIFRWVIDFDFSSLYPSIKITNNIAPSCLIGKLFIEESVEDLTKKINKLIINKEKETNTEEDGVRDEFDVKDNNISIADIDDQGTEFMDDFMIGDVGRLGNKWFNLPTTDELAKLVEERFKIDSSKVIDESDEIEKTIVYEIG